MTEPEKRQDNRDQEVAKDKYADGETEERRK